MRKVYRLVVYSHGDESYKMVIGEPTDDKNRLAKAMLGLDRQLSDDFYSVIEEVEDD